MLGRKSGESGTVSTMVGDHNPSPEAPPKSKMSKRRRSKGDLRRGAMEKIWRVGVIEEVRGDDSIKRFLPTGQKYLLSPRGGDGS